MLKMKKILSVALVVVMLLSTVAFSGSALEEGKEFGMILKADKTVAEIVPGATVTVTLYFEMSNWDQLMSDMKICLLYDSNVYTPDLSSREFLGDLAGYAKDATQPNINASYATAVMNASTMSDEEKATYNSGVMQQILSDVGLGATNKAGFSVTEDADGVSVAQMSFEFNVTGDKAAIAAGNINIAIADAYKSQQTIKKTTGSATPTYIGSFDNSKANILANMPEEAASIINYVKNQIRFAGITATSTKADYTDAFAVRTIAKITTEDFNTAFGGDEATAKAGITHIGFVYALKSNVTDANFSADTAIAVAKGTPAEGYVVKDVTYLQRVSDGYQFTCLVSVDDSAEARADGYNCVAYACYNDGTEDHWYVAAAAQSADFSSLFSTNWALIPD